jgi:4-hydroxy-4-methyl-2-oxoglutarate aldolase
MLEEPPVLTLIEDFPRPSAEQIAAFKGVPTGFVCDAMNGLGAMATAIAPVSTEYDCSAVGTALVAQNGPADILATLAAIEMAQPGDMVIAAVDGFQGCAAAGDRVLGMLKTRGVAGFVTDGPMRDYAGMVEVGLPAWCTGLNPNSPYSKGPGTAGGAAMIGGLQVRSGDIVVADRDGVVVVPQAQIEAVIARLPEVTALEEALDAKVSEGFTTLLDIQTMLAEGRAVRG